MSRASLYVIKNNELNRVKIGVTNDIDRRISNIQTSSGSIIQLLYLSHLVLNPYKIEHKIHKHFKNHRHIGEWFNLEDNLAVSVVKSFIDSYGKEDSQIKKLKLKRKIVDGGGVELEYPKVDYNLNISNFKRIKPGVYSDKKGNLYSIKYRPVGGGWEIDKLNKL